MNESEIEIGKVYTIVRKDIGTLCYTRMYDGRWFINVKVLRRNDKGIFICTARGDDGKYLGSGGGLKGKSEIPLLAEDLEPLKT